jgi:acyl CoA:acetate/3-ketoacid CoA transferase
MIDGPSQFDFYSGGGLDIAFLGFGEIDASGNVNVSKLGGVTVGPGGFIDIAQNARKVVFCGSFDAKGTVLDFGEGKLTITRHGEVTKLVGQVEQITWSGREALRRGQQVVYVTERAVFRLTEKGLALTEVAPGIDVRRDVLERMQFAPLTEPVPPVMAATHFNA